VRSSKAFDRGGRDDVVLGRTLAGEPEADELRRADRRYGFLRDEPARRHRRRPRDRTRLGQCRSDVSHAAGCGQCRRGVRHPEECSPHRSTRRGSGDMDDTKMMDFVNRAVDDVGALLGGAMVVIGDKLGLYHAMAGAGWLTPAELAARTGTAERYVREWLSAQAARSYVSYDGDGRFSLPDEHAVPLTDETSAACVIGAFEIALGSVLATDKIAERFRSGGGFAWGAHDEHVLGGCSRFFRPGYINNLASACIPALDGVDAKLA